MNERFIFFVILFVTIFSIISGCAEITKDSSPSQDDDTVEKTMLKLNESIENLKSEMEKNSSINEVSLLDIEDEKILVVLIYDPLEADALFKYSCEMCDKYLKGYGIDNITIDVRYGREQVVYAAHRLDS